MSQDKLFTLAEANALIPQIELIMERMQRLSMKVREEIETLAENAASRCWRNSRCHRCYA